MAIIAYLDKFPARNALDLLATRDEHQLLRVDSGDPIDSCFQRLATAHAYQCVGARDEVPLALRVDAEFLGKTPELLVVSASGSGVDVFDLAACTEAGVVAVNQAGANAESVAEHAIALMIGLQKNIVRADRALHRSWNGARAEFFGRDLLRRTVGIVGLGNIGRRVAEICHSAFRCKVLAFDPFLSAETIQSRHASKVSFDQLLAESEIVTVHAPLNDGTHNLFDRSAFAAMQRDCVFINTARGTIHNESALAEALGSGHLAGAGLDVFEREPPAANHPLLGLDNVIVTPHVAGGTYDSLENMARYAATQLLDLFDGKPVARPVNPEVLPRFRRRLRKIIG